VESTPPKIATSHSQWGISERRKKTLKLPYESQCVSVGDGSRGVARRQAAAVWTRCFAYVR
jgi:hypothetical protein